MTITELVAAMAAKETTITVTESPLIDLLFGLSTAFKQNSAYNMLTEAITGAAMQATTPAAANTSMPYAHESQTPRLMRRQLMKIKQFPMVLTLTGSHLPVGTYFTQDIDQVRAILAAAPEYLITLVSAHQIVLDRK
ncbi:hypothetical protein [Schleiferilactobacillus harbinensis]|uniref:hypothetical protein n=1 Tax=Schleiferilactobacillus harbinensis TaxID=304207 RepID=UPI0039EC1CBB